MRQSISIILMNAEPELLEKISKHCAHKTDISALQLRAIIKYAPK